MTDETTAPADHVDVASEGPLSAALSHADESICGAANAHSAPDMARIQIDIALVHLRNAIAMLRDAGE